MPISTWTPGASFAATILAVGLCFAPLGCGDDVSEELIVDPDLPATLGGPALGVSITQVEANQGAGVLLAEGDTYIEKDERNAYLVRERDTLIRFQHVLDDPDNWVPRDLTGILHILPPDDAPEMLRVRTFRVEQDSDPRRLSGNFYFSLIAEEAVPGTRFWLELRETDSAVDVGGLSEGLTISPAEPALIGFEDTPLSIEVVLVPVDYRYPDPQRYPDIDAEDIALFTDDLLQQNPVQDIEISVREEPLIWEEQLTNLGDLLSPTRALRESDGAAPHVYYHALVSNGGPSVNMVAGIAWLTNDTMEAGDRRVAATVFYKRVRPADEEEGTPERVFPPTGSSRTWVHEIGHNQGLLHVYCPGGDAANPDDDYPHEDGKLGIYGFGIRNFHMYTPTVAHDYMSYCGNSWVSDWTWNKTFTRIETLTAWSLAEPNLIPDPVTSVPTLVGTLHPDGSERWWLFDAPPPAPELRSATQVLEFSRDGELIERAYSQVEMLSDGETMVVSAPVPPALAALELDELRASVQIARVGLGEAPRAIKLSELHSAASFANEQHTLLRAPDQ